MEYEGAERRSQQRCPKDVSMTCSHLNQKDDRIVTVKNFSGDGIYFESDVAMLIGSFIVLRTPAAHEVKALASPPAAPFAFSIASADSRSCRDFRSHAVARVIRCQKSIEETARFGIGAEFMMLSP